MNITDRKLVISLLSLALISFIMYVISPPTPKYRRVKHCIIRIKENNYECLAMRVKTWWNNGVSFSGTDMKTKTYVKKEHSGNYTITYFWKWEKRK